jgi:hypothetical protein
MPVNGLVWSCDALRLFVESNATGSHTGDGTGSYGHSGSLYTQSTPDAVAVDTGFSLGLSGASNGNSWAVTYAGAGAPLGETYTGSGWDAITAEIVLSDLKIYCIGGLWRIVFDYEVFAQGVSRRTGSVDTTSAGMGPAYITYLGIPARLSGSASATTISLPTYADDDLYSYYSDCTAVLEGGWEFDQGAGYVGLPVTLCPGSAPAVDAGCSDPGVGTVSAAFTNAVEITSYAEASGNRTLYYSGEITECCTETFCDGISIGSTCTTQTPAVVFDQYETVAESFSKGGYVMALPDLERTIERFNTDFRALLYRTEMPQTKSLGTAVCTVDGSSVTTTNDTEVHPHQAEILEEVTNAEAAMEDTLLDYHGYAPWGHSGSWSKSITYYEISGAVECPNAQECPGEDDTATTISTLVGYVELPDAQSLSASRGFAFPSSVGSSSDMAGYLGHAEAMPRYINSWPNPHWSYFRWREDWEVDGAPVDKDDYWEALGQQWIYNAALGSPTESRNHLVSESLDQDGQGPFLDTFMSGLRWPGLCRWQTKAITPRTAYTYTSASSALWTGEDCTLSHGASITVTPSEDSCEVKLRLGSFTVEPFLWPHLADLFTLAWSATNVTSIKVYLESVTGARVLLNDNDPTVPKVWPSGISRKYAGSWAQDFGADGITDEGADFAAALGVSPATMGDPERAVAFQLLADRTAANLVFVIVPTNPAATVTIHYPEIEYTLSASRLMLWENPYHAAIVHPDGPGIRTGMWFTGTSGTLLNPPSIYAPTTRPTLIDGLILERLLVRGVAHDDGLTTELTTLYDSYEGQSVGQVRGYSHWFWLPLTGSAWPMASVNSMSEVPPLACFPRMERDTSWAETGDYVQKVWMWAQGPTRFIAPGVTPELRADDDTTVWTSAGTGVAGWSVYQHEHAVDNTEDDFGVWVGTTRLAVLRPWRGHFFVPRGPGALNSIAYAVRADLKHYRGRVSGGSATIQAADNARTSWATVGSALTAEEICLATVPAGSILAGVIDGGAYKLYQSTGGNWTLSYTLGSGATNPTLTVSADGMRFHYWMESTTVKGARVDASGGIQGSEFSVTGLGAVDEDGLASANTVGSGASLKVLLTTVEGGALVTRESTDGEAFT